MLKKWLGACAVAALFVLSACGGGGGGGGGAEDNGGDGGFTLSTGEVVFTAATSTTYVPSQRVSMSNIGKLVAYVVVSNTSGGPIPEWLSVTPYMAQSYASVGVDASKITKAGTYETIVRVATQDASKKQLFHRDVKVTLTVQKVPKVSWNIYDGSLHPAVTDAVTLANGSKSWFTLLTAVNVSEGYSYQNYFTPQGNGTVELNSSAVPANRSGAQYNGVINNTGVYPKTFTVLARVLPVAGVTYNAGSEIRLLDIDLAMSDAGVIGSRMEATLVADAQVVGIRVNNVDTVLDSDAMATVDLSLPHIYQIAVTLTSAHTGTIKVYVDGATEPAINVSTSNLQLVGTAGDNYLRIGDFRDKVYRSYIDWVIWTEKAAYTAADLQGQLPTGIGVTTGY
ncbi:MAG: hypothetical protein REI09_10865 [Candidatus Dactylopiibacterium sp.]|nr:hypothetical protein [Candidatus Dactylopiibacterium sp.]